MNECYFFGVWKYPGHSLFTPHRGRAPREVWHLLDISEQSENGGLDGVWAPRLFHRTNELVWLGKYPRAERRPVEYDTRECQQGCFLHHELPCGFTIIQWWDRCQGDARAGCNSSILARGTHTSEEMLSIGRDKFPLVFENLARHEIQLVEVVKR